MSSNFRFIARNVDISKILKQLEDNVEDWYAVSKFDHISGIKEPSGFLPLVMAEVVNEGDEPKDTELLYKTPLFEKYNEVREWLELYGIDKFARAAFLRLPPGGTNGMHIDEGKYYLTKDRYHLSLTGRYRYQVGDEVHIIEPGTFFWFDNKKPHTSTNISDVDRITFVFDVPHSQKNP